MSRRSRRSYVGMKSEYPHMEQEINDGIPQEDESNNDVDVLQLPSRREIHNPKEVEKKTKENRKKKKLIQFPLVRVLLVLFLLLVAAILTYPFWIEKLI